MWRRLPEQEHIWWGFLGNIIPSRGHPRLIKMVTPDIAKAVEQVKTEIRLDEEEELTNFYSKHSVCSCESGMDIQV